MKLFKLFSCVIAVALSTPLLAEDVLYTEAESFLETESFPEVELYQEAAYYDENKEVMLRSDRTSPALVSAIDYHSRKLYLFNYETDDLLIIDPLSINGWPGDIPLQHTVVSADGERLVITSDSSESEPARAIELEIKKIDWNLKKAKLKVVAIHKLTAPGAAPIYPAVYPVNNVQNVPAWTLASVRQIHGPTLLPRSNLLYLTDWTSDQIRVLDMDKHQLASFEPLAYPGYSEQTHGVIFNAAGTIGLGTGYFYDNKYIDIYRVNKNGVAKPKAKVLLGDESSYAAFSHYVAWLDNRYAYTATMQMDGTSLTPNSVTDFIGPSVWLIDTWKSKVTQVLDTTFDVNGSGVFRSASDIAVAGGKLFVAEEDTIDYEFGEDGYISIFSIKNFHKPKLITRLRPGVELPANFAVAHTLSITPDERYVYAASWASGYVLKIDVKTNKVVKTYSSDDGLVMPHGIFVAGGNR